MNGLGKAETKALVFVSGDFLGSRQQSNSANQSLHVKSTQPDRPTYNHSTTTASGLFKSWQTTSPQSRHFWTTSHHFNFRLHDTEHHRHLTAERAALDRTSTSTYNIQHCPTEKYHELFCSILYSWLMTPPLIANFEVPSSTLHFQMPLAIYYLCYLACFGLLPNQYQYQPNHHQTQRQEIQPRLCANNLTPEMDRTDGHENKTTTLLWSTRGRLLRTLEDVTDTGLTCLKNLMYRDCWVSSNLDIDPLLFS